MKKKDIKSKMRTFNEIVDLFLSVDLPRMAQSGRLQKLDAITIVALLSSLQTVHEVELEEVKKQKAGAGDGRT